jgi:hypothetical protein
MEKREIQALLIKYAEEKCTGDERALIESAYLFENTKHIDELSKEDISSDLAEIFNELSLSNQQR